MTEKATSAVQQESSGPSRAKSRRLWWMLVVLMILLNTVLWQRPLIASWLGSLAIRAASRDDSKSAERYMRWAQVAWRQAPEAAFAAARLSRRENNLTDFANQLKRARYLGIPNDQADRELWLASAQSGQLNAVEDKLGELMETAGADGPQVCEAYAQGYMRMRNFNAALALLEAWATDYPADARPHAWIGWIHAELQSNELAEKSFRAALKLDPNHARAAVGLGNLLNNLKRPSEAIPFFQVAVEHPVFGHEAAVGLANALQAMSRSEEAMQVLQVASKRFPANDNLLGALADGLIKEGDYQAAEKLLEPEIKAGTKRRGLRYVYAIALRGLGRVEEAKMHFDYAAEANEVIADANRQIVEVSQRPRDAELRYRIGAAHLGYGNTEDGLMWLNSALQIAPSHQPTHSALAEYYEKQSRENSAYIALAQRHRALAATE